MTFDKPSGPVLLCDKSAIQGLSAEEIRFLDRHFFLNIPPVLVIEILGDLKKGGPHTLSKDIVVVLAKKAHRIQSMVSVDYRVLCVASLLGISVEMNRMTKIPAGKRDRAKDGTPGTSIGMRPEEMALLRWVGGDFTEAEAILAEKWREYAKNTGLSSYKRKLDTLGLTPPRVTTFDEIGAAADAILGSSAMQTKLLTWLVKEWGIIGEEQSLILRRWEATRDLYIREFAPYAYYCLRVYLVFIIGLYNSLIGPRPSHKVDLEYCYYLPFCMVFTSADNFHKKLMKLFIGSDQNFVEANELKADLRRIADEWGTLSKDEIANREVNYGHYPLPNEGSVIFKLWQKYMSPWKPLSGNILYGMSREQRIETIESLGLKDLFERMGFADGGDIGDILEISGIVGLKTDS